MIHSARQYADALKALLPPGAAWNWPVGGAGDALVLATAQELARVDVGAQAVMDQAILLHVPGRQDYTLSGYQAVADAATHIIPRKPAAVGCTVGYRCWSNAAPVSVSPAPVVSLSDQVKPLAIGGAVGDLAWSSVSPYYLIVSFDYSVINEATVVTALLAFKQAHVFLYVVDTPRF